MATDFDKILFTLQAEHNRQVHDLQEEIAGLKKRWGKSQVHVSISSDENSGHGLALEQKVQHEFWRDNSLKSSTSVLPSNLPSGSTSCHEQPPKPTLHHVAAPGTDRKSAHATTKSMHILRILEGPPRQLSSIASGIRWNDIAWWRTFCESPQFDIAVSLIIVVNTVIMALEIQYDGIRIGYSIDYPGYSSPETQVWPGMDAFFSSAEWFFMVIYAAEVLFKLAILGCAFFRKVWNWLDLLVVISGILDMIREAGLTIDPKTLRILRLCKLARGIKALKLGKFCDSLQLLVSSITASVSTLFWALLVLIMFQCIAGMTMNQMLATYFEDKDVEGTDKRVVFLYFGTFSRSLMTMFEVVLGNWASPVRIISPHVGEFYGAAILLYRCTCGFSVLNVVSAVFIQQTMKLMTSQTDIMLMEKKRSEKEFRKKLQTLLRLAGIPEDKIVSWKELENKLHTPDVKRLCFTLGIDHFDLEDIFHLLHRQGGMTREEFLEAALKIRREARTIDVARLLVHSRKMRSQLEHIRENIEDVGKHLTRLELTSDSPVLHLPSQKACICGI